MTLQQLVERSPANSLASIDFECKTRIVFRPGALSLLGEIARDLGCGRALLVTDPGIERAGHVARAMESLRAVGLEARVFDGVTENPTTLNVDAGAAAARQWEPDLIVGLGGGSSMDCAKGINFIHTSGGVMKDYWGIGKARGPMLPLIAIPTTAGTGSECQSFALISDPLTHLKMACGDRRAAARVALLDPELTLTQPRAVTAATGLDALSHAVESFVTLKATPLSRMLSREAWTRMFRSFPRVLEEPGDAVARGEMLLGAALAGLAIENSMLGATHSAANPLTAGFGVVHGQAVGLLLPHVVRFNAPVAEARYRELAALAGLAPPASGEARGVGDDAGARALAELLERFQALGGFPTHLAELRVREEDLQRLSEEASQQWTAQFNPRTATQDDFLGIYRAAL